MARKNESVLGLVPVRPAPHPTFDGGLAPTNPNHTFTREEKRVLDEWHKERLVIDTTTAKTVFGMTKMAEIHQHSANEFDETVGYILAIKEDQRGQEHQRYIDEFTIRQVQMFARHMLGAVEVGCTNIGTEIHRSLHLMPEEERRSLLQRLFGR